jgi:hypothetical protein
MIIKEKALSLQQCDIWNKDLRFYTLDDDLNTVPKTDFKTWFNWFRHSLNPILNDGIGEFTIRTSFIGIKHVQIKATPIFFETRVHETSDKKKLGARTIFYCNRCRICKEALKGHEKVVAFLKEETEGGPYLPNLGRLPQLSREEQMATGNLSYSYQDEDNTYFINLNTYIDEKF